LKDSKKINSFDWSGLLLSECMTMCNCAKIDAKKRMTPTPPAGCLLIMTVNSKCHQSIKFSLALINVYCFFFPFYFFCWTIRLILVYLQCQVFYFDNIQHSADHPIPDGLPRVQYFDSNTLSRLVMSDCRGLNGSPPMRIFGAGKVKTLLFTVTALFYNFSRLYYH
jgi:hypothetical protein